jgi:hypothetical protein
MPSSRPFIIALAVLVAWLPSSALDQSVDQSFYYKLSTQFRGNGMKLDVFNGGPKNNLTRLEPDQDVSGQFWRFVGNGNGTFRLSTLFRGPNMCLDIFNGGPKNNQPHLANCANLSGQLWNILVTQDGDMVRLTTKFRGPGMCLEHLQRWPKQQSATPRQLRQPLGSALDIDENRQARGERDQN